MLLSEADVILQSQYEEQHHRPSTSLYVLIA